CLSWRETRPSIMPLSRSDYEAALQSRRAASFWGFPCIAMSLQAWFSSSSAWTSPLGPRGPWWIQDVVRLGCGAELLFDRLFALTGPRCCHVAPGAIGVPERGRGGAI